jgi:hypothetical protein
MRITPLAHGALVILACGLPWYLWAVPWPLCLAVALVLLYFANSSSAWARRTDMSAQLRFDAKAMAVAGLLWAFGVGGPGLVGALAVALFGVSFVVALVGEANRKRKWNSEFKRTWDAKQADRQRQPDYTGKWCMACGRNVPLSIRPGDKCPHCHMQFARELH